MNNQVFCHEILLNLSTFNKWQLVKPSSKLRINRLSPTEKVEEACWNGMLNKFLPEIINQSANISVWKIRHGKNFLEIEVGKYPLVKEQRLSIYSNVFLQGSYMN